ncbi:putative tail assembly chaperone [Campylobacter phage F358]|uniref:Putative tail assembly chaperone n=6 Tax=Fletchervirus CPX TaxID=1110702 RepID=A0A7T3KEY9_9CAUD|nr:putative tail assembly chaperone [Campylobacter phage F357]QPX63998.1 putative tail assembly chaperone [Campylobacter phage F358]QPX64160.1 putative tail assembly chaperone [Campylobacter phage F360]QPX64324.1 putative tail assembly chaperone [Campylobacter phage F361]QPX64653.1 putative tail assembly chaperone [Campylobacter phage F367]QPX64817.1 putative tail assembly chaperone [Campylobacter phage F368]
MENINKDLITIYRYGNNFELYNDFHFIFDFDVTSKGFTLEKYLVGNNIIRIPKGFRTDFGSIPQLFQSIISPVGKPTKAYVLHDFLCGKSNKGDIPRALADELFLDAMKLLGVNVIKRYVVWAWVRIYGIVYKPLVKFFKDIWNKL